MWCSYEVPINVGPEIQYPEKNNLKGTLHCIIILELSMEMARQDDTHFAIGKDWRMEGSISEYTGQACSQEHV